MSPSANYFQKAWGYGISVLVRKECDPTKKLMIGKDKVPLDE